MLSQGFKTSEQSSGSQRTFGQELRKFGAQERKMTILWPCGAQFPRVPAH